MRTAVLISGRGSNLQALIAAGQAPDFPAEIALVLSNRPDAAGLGHAAAAGIASRVVDQAAFAGPDRTAARAAFDEALTVALEAADIELVCLAGFMRVLTGDFVARWRDRLINIHPSLLPAFPGLDTHARAVDQGPIIGQAAVPVLGDDTPETLAARVLAMEHRLYPACLRLVAEGRAKVVGERVVVPEGPNGDAFLIQPPG
jgi:phosphoribosylglycinamide formyltransferase-1